MLFGFRAVALAALVAVTVTSMAQARLTLDFEAIPTLSQQPISPVILAKQKILLLVKSSIMERLPYS